jgi:hypothetical protein
MITRERRLSSLLAFKNKLDGDVKKKLVSIAFFSDNARHFLITIWNI